MRSLVEIAFILLFTMVCSLLFFKIFEQNKDIAQLNQVINSLQQDFISESDNASGGAESPIREPNLIKGVFPIHEKDFLMLTSPYGYRISPLLNYALNHDGIDIIAVRYAQIVSIADGVIKDHWPAPGVRGGVRWRGHPVYGGLLVIEHTDGTESVYAHLSSTYVNTGDKVKAGEIIGRMGNTGMVSGTRGGHHLHFEIRVEGISQNPLLHIDIPQELK